MMRAFVAVDLSSEVKENLNSLLAQLRRLKADVKWVKENSLHLTLKFLGEISEKEAAKVVAILEAISSDYAPFQLSFRSVGQFPEKGSPRVFWVGIEPSPALLYLQERLDIALEKEGFARETRDFHPHLTLGRVKSLRGCELVRRELKKYENCSFGQMEANALTLFQSFLRPEGAEYKIIHQVKLGR